MKDCYPKRKLHHVTTILSLSHMTYTSCCHGDMLVCEVLLEFAVLEPTVGSVTYHCCKSANKTFNKTDSLWCSSGQPEKQNSGQHNLDVSANVHKPDTALCLLNQAQLTLRLSRPMSQASVVSRDLRTFVVGKGVLHIHTGSV